MFANLTNNNVSCHPYSTYFLRRPRDLHFDIFLSVIIPINVLIASIASCSNAVVIYTISRTPSLQTPSNILILGLAISDLSVGVFSQPSFCLFKFAELRRNLDLYCSLGGVYTFSTLPLAAISFLTLTVITADRFLAVHLHLRYQDIITTKRAGIALGFNWFFGVCFAVYTGVFHHEVALLIFNSGFFAIALFLNIYFIFRVCLVVRRHSLQIQSQQLAQQQTMNMVRFRKSVKVMFLVIGAFVFCYIPFGAMRMVVGVIGDQSYALRIGFIVSETLVMLNGVLNPIIYCWRIEGIRNAAMALLRRICTRNVNNHQ